MKPLRFDSSLRWLSRPFVAGDICRDVFSGPTTIASGSATRWMLLSIASTPSRGQDSAALRWALRRISRRAFFAVHRTERLCATRRWPTG